MRLPGGRSWGGQSRWGRADPESAQATDSASDARQHNERESFPTRSRLPTTKCKRKNLCRAVRAMTNGCPTAVQPWSHHGPSLARLCAGRGRLMAQGCPAKPL